MHHTARGGRIFQASLKTNGSTCDAQPDVRRPTSPEATSAQNENRELKQTAGVPYGQRGLQEMARRDFGGRGRDGKPCVRFEIHERLEPRELGLIRKDAQDAAYEWVPGHAHVKVGQCQHGFGDVLLP